MAEQQALPVEAPKLPQTPNQPGSVYDMRDGITIESNTGTTDELVKSIDALDKAVDQHSETAENPPPPRDPSGKFTSRSRRHSAVARMEDATAKEAAAKRERDEVKAENARLKADLEKRQAAPVAPPMPVNQPPAPRISAPPPEPEPDPRDETKYPAGEYDPRYLRDVGRYEARQEYQRQRATEQQAQAYEQHFKSVESGMSAYASRMQEAFPDADGLQNFLKEMPKELVNLRPSAVQAIVAPQAPITAANVIADCISDSETPVPLMKHLKDNPKEFQRLLTLHPIAVFRAMGRLEATLAAATAPRSAPRESVSRARPPVQRVETVPQMSDAPPGDDATDEEHVAYYNRKEIARRTGRG